MAKTDLRRLAFQLTERNNLNHPFNKETGFAGLDWVSGFFKQHSELSLRSPEPTSAARAMGFDRAVVSSFFNLIDTIFMQEVRIKFIIYNSCMKK